MEIYNIENIGNIKGFQVLVGIENPENNVNADFGSLYIRPYGTAVSPSIYVKITEVGNRQGWIPLQNIHIVEELPTNLDDYYSRARIFYNNKTKEHIYWDGSKFRRLADKSDVENKTYGTTEERPENVENNFKYYDTTINKTITFKASINKWFDEEGKDPYLKTYGTTQERPIDRVSNGFIYFDTSLNKPIWRTEGKWVDATGATV